MKLILTAMAFAIATPVAAQAGPASPPHAAVPHGGAPAADAATPPRHVHRGPNVVEEPAPVEGAPAGGMAHHAGMACGHHAGHHAEMFASIDVDHDGSISRAEWDAHGAQMAACQAPAAAGAPAGVDHSGHAGHGG